MYMILSAFDLRDSSWDGLRESERELYPAVFFLEEENIWTGNMGRAVLIKRIKDVCE